ncbi:DUF5131 family protein [Longimycelium tulufanense]|uniref:DUF5131 family protein n=1 Tax=Longimycelium tulufanense TaxID=907463 RepID=UPI001E477DC1|nr:phage Gp37/Gp68 family protein [Longimycelium tulufanense]
MSTNSRIEWTDATWNPVTGCTKVSEGCRNCYITRTPPFRMEHRDFDQPGPGGTTGVRLHPERLNQPLHWRTPRRVFVNSLADLFHDEVPDEYIARVFAVMAATPQHTYQILTKRPARMRSLLVDECTCGNGHAPGVHFRSAMDWVATPHNPDHVPGTAGKKVYYAGWPLPNVWLGVSVENQQWADIRIPALLDTPAAVRFLSCEPLLGPVDLSSWTTCGHESMSGGEGPVELLGRWPRRWVCDGCAAVLDDDTGTTRPGLSWVIAGGESGPGARPMHPDWVRSLRDQCQAAGVPFFFKQWGEWAPEAVCATEHGAANARYLERDGSTRPARWGARGSAITVQRNGKHRTGRRLDGRTHDEVPKAVVS